MSLPASPAAFLASIVSLLLGAACVTASENITMAATMRTLDPRGFRTIFNVLLMLLTGNILPLTLYPDSWQPVLRLLPYAQMLDAPARLYTGEYPLAEVPGIFLLQIAWIIALVALGCFLWNQNQKRLVLQGG